MKQRALDAQANGAHFYRAMPIPRAILAKLVLLLIVACICCEMASPADIDAHIVTAFFASAAAIFSPCDAHTARALNLIHSSVP